MKRLAILVTILMFVFVLCGCSISTGFSRTSKSSSMKASYSTFNGSKTKEIQLKANQKLTFHYQDDEGLRAVIKMDEDEIFEITDGSSFTVKEDGTYSIAVEGDATDGQFELSWNITSK